MAPSPAPIPTLLASRAVVDSASIVTVSVRRECLLPWNSISRSSNEINARPLILPEGDASITLPWTALPVGIDPPSYGKASVNTP